MEITKKPGQEKPPGRSKRGESSRGSKKRRICLQNGSCENSHQGDNPGEHGRVQTENATGMVVGGGRAWDRRSGGPRGGRRVSTGCLVLWDNGISVTRIKGGRGQTHLERLERLIGGGVNGKDHTSFTVAGKERQSSLQRGEGGGTENIYSRSLFAIEPQRRAGIDDGEAPLRDHGRVSGNWLIVGIDAERRGSQPSAWVVEA